MSNAEAVCKSIRAFEMQDQAGAPESLRHTRTHLNALCLCSHEREGICDGVPLHSPPPLCFCRQAQQWPLQPPLLASAALRCPVHAQQTLSGLHTIWQRQICDSGTVKASAGSTRDIHLQGPVVSCPLWFI